MKQGRLVPQQVPLRVDFAGGWLDVPKLARPGAFIVNCAIQPLVSLTNWPYEIGAGLGGSAAKAILEGRDGIASELDLGVGWQDPAVIRETGLCVWRSGPKPVLEQKADTGMLVGRMALLWTGQTHNTPGLVDRPRDYDLIEKAGRLAAKAVAMEITNHKTQMDAADGIASLSAASILSGAERSRRITNNIQIPNPQSPNSPAQQPAANKVSAPSNQEPETRNEKPFNLLCEAVRLSWEMQKKEGMTALPDHGERAKKYCGGGFGGYAVYLYADAEARKRALETITGMRVIEPYAADDVVLAKPAKDA